MKKIFLYSLLFLISSSFSITNAAPISRAKISKLIKAEILTRHRITDSEFAGFMTSDDLEGAFCNERVVDAVKILRIGEVHQRSFKIKFTIKGSCKLSRPVKVDIRSWYDIEKETGSRYLRITKMIDGRVPYRNVPLTALIRKDDFGDWAVDDGWDPINFYNHDRDRPESKSSLAYREKLYLKLGKGLQKDYINGKDTFTTSQSRGGTSLQKNKKMNSDSRQLITEVNAYFKEKPETAKLFNSQSKAKQVQLADRIIKGKTKERRYQIFLQIGRELQEIISVGNSSRHSHAGRFHSHALPKKGKKHRHGNGATGK